MIVTTIPGKNKPSALKQFIKLSLGLLTFTLIITATCTSSWAVLKNDALVGNKEIAKFGIWTSCVRMANGAGDEQCENFHDANFMVYRLQNKPDIEIDYGRNVDRFCFENRNITNGNKTVLTRVQICQIDRLFEKQELERCRVFSIMVCIVAAVVTCIWIIGFSKPDTNGFAPAFLSLLIPIWYVLALGTFAGTYNSRFDIVTLEYSWSFVLAWIAVALSLFHSIFAFYAVFTD